MLRAVAWRRGSVAVVMRASALVCAVAVVGWLAASAAGGTRTSAASSASVVVSPLPGTVSALPGTQVSFLGAAASELRDISVVGSLTGGHTGRFESYRSQTGASFVPTRPFRPGERVTVHATLKSSAGARPLSTWFTVSQPVSVSQDEFPSVPGTPADVQSFHSQPALHPPTVTASHPASGVAPGYLFGSPALGPGQYGPMIFDNAGNVVWFRPLASGLDAADFQVQSYAGARDLTWWQGRTLRLGYGEGEDVIANSAYKTVAIVKAGNGLQADEHEFIVTPQGQAFVTAFSPVETNLSSAGGPASGIALDGVVQEIDIKTGLVMWEWHSLGHVALADSYSNAPAASTAPFDYFHVNSLFVQPDGNVLVSARNTWGIYEVSKRTGTILWRLGGKHSTFTQGAGVPFAWQHNAEILANGEVSVFDDEGVPAVKPPSRGEIIALNQHTHTASLVKQFLPATTLVTTSQGNVQLLPGGDRLVGFGGLPNFTEYNAHAQIVYDARFPTGENSYRVYREQWTGHPAGPPAVAASTVGATTTVYASWNGATAIASWQLLTGSSPTRLSVVSTMPAAGFETAVMTPAAAYVEVRALSSSGALLGTSKPTVPAGG